MNILKATSVTLGLTLVAGGLAAQEKVEPQPLPVGTEAPDFKLPAATKEGVASKPVSLKDLRGQTVVLAFFYRARTKG
ncbi:MAG: redoxin domain-containing protein [Gemmatimonadota bacterium]